MDVNPVVRDGSRKPERIAAVSGESPRRTQLHRMAVASVVSLLIFGHVSAAEPSAPPDTAGQGAPPRASAAALPVLARVVRCDDRGLAVCFTAWTVVVEAEGGTPQGGDTAEKFLRLVTTTQKLELKPGDFHLEDARGQRVERVAIGDVPLLILGEAPIPEDVLRCLHPDARVVRVKRLPTIPLPHVPRLPAERKKLDLPLPKALPKPRGPKPDYQPGPGPAPPRSVP